MYNRDEFIDKKTEEFNNKPENKIALEVFEILKSNQVNRLTYERILKRLDDLMGVNLHL